MLRITLALVVACSTSWAEDAQLLVLTHAGLYKHASLADAEKALAEWGPENGYRVTSLQGYTKEKEEIDLSIITADYLKDFDAIFFMTNGNLPFTDSQRAALLDFVRSGKGLVGVHCASLTCYDWPAFGAMMGGYFIQPLAQRRLFVLKVEDETHPSTRMLGPSWPLEDEFYLFGKKTWNAERPKEAIDTLFGNPIHVPFSRENAHVLLSIDTTKSDMTGLEDRATQNDDLPQAWWRTEQKGRVFYTALGHRPELWTTDKAFKAHLLGGLRWALGIEK